ncbi:putative ABC transporter permease [Enterococcus sp. BWM-S5]|uniref:ABC transporter permease n=1 Tax=Enterococcus larvae TaxID=2794352 RepID=A0ABS4CFV9_9ENTE|nr:putative ABC transporter permease [Enterococcus larvae]MBP1044827.1 putative ABC transporter permease [Enterococcus larvae]
MKNDELSITGRIIDDLEEFNYIQLLTYLFVFGFLGWIFETTVVLINFHEFTFRGLFFAYRNLHYYLPSISADSLLGRVRVVWGLPVIDMYGYGAIMIIYSLRHLKHEPIKLFFFGMGFMTLFELLGSYFCSDILHHSYWNYSHEFMNFQGRICLQSAVVWGILSVITIQWLKPQADKLYYKWQKNPHYSKVIIILTVYFILCSLTKYVIDPGIIPN